MRIQSNGIGLEVEDSGAGEPLLMVMGIGAQMMLWPPGLMEGLRARGFRTIRFDNRDTGQSDRLDHLGKANVPRLALRRILRLPVNPPYTMSDMANDTVGVLDALGIDKAHIVGASMGGMVCQTVAIEHPDRVLSLTSIFSTPGGLRSGLPRPRALKALFDRPEDASKQAYADSMVRFFQLMRGDGFPFDEAGVRAYAELAYDRGPASAAGFARQAGAIATAPDRSPRLAKLTIPALVVHGEQDPLVPVSAGRATARAIPDSRLMVIPGMGHHLPAEVWPRIADAIRDLATDAGARLDRDQRRSLG